MSINLSSLLIRIYYLRTLDSSVSNSIRKRIPTETRVWNTALTYFDSGMTNSYGLALNRRYVYQNKKLKLLYRNEKMKKLLGKYVFGLIRCYQPWIIKNSKTTIRGSSMGSSCKESDVHTITRYYRWWHRILRSSSMADSQKKLVFFVPTYIKDNNYSLSIWKSQYNNITQTEL